jgi:phage gp29-like protein
MSKLGANKTREKTRALHVTGDHGLSPFQRLSPKPQISRWSPSVGYAELTWGQVQSILQNAERGYMETWGDLTRRMIATDDHIAAVYETRVASVSGARREVKPAEVAPGLERYAQQAADDCRQLLDSLPSPERMIANLLDADFTGFAASEIIWSPRGDMVWADDIVWISPRRFRFSDSFELYLYDNGIGAARARELDIPMEESAVNGVLGLPLTRNKYLVHIPQILPNYPTSSGLLLACVRAWWVKSWIMKFWLSGAEVAGNPRLIGRLPDQAASADVADALYQALNDLSADGVGVLKGESNIEVLRVEAQGTGSVWETLIKRCDAAISKAVLGSTINVEVGEGGGNRALAESQGDITITPRLQRSARLVCNTIERDLFQPFLEFNRHRYGGMTPVPSLSLILYEAQAEIDQLAVASGVVKVDELRQSRGLEPLGEANGGGIMIAAASVPEAFAPSIPVEIARAPSDAPEAEPVAPVQVEAAPVATEALNGAQVAALMEILQSVYAGTLPAPAAREIIRGAFPTIDDASISRMLMQEPTVTPVVPSSPDPTATPVAAGIAGGLGSQASQTEYRAVTVEADAGVPFKTAAWDRALRAAHRAGLAHAATSGR